MAKGKKHKFHMENEAGDTITGGIIGADAPSPGSSTNHFAVARNLDVDKSVAVVLPTSSGSTHFIATPTAPDHGKKGTIHVPVVFREFDQATGEHLLGETVTVQLWQGGKLLAMTLFDLDDDVPGDPHQRDPGV